LFTAVLPPLLLMLWQSLVMPNVLYRFAWVRAMSLECRCDKPLFSLFCDRLFLFCW